MENYKWETKPEENHREYKVHLFISRNKDNRNIEGFSERRMSFVSRIGDARVLDKWKTFLAGGVPGEFCRHYVSLNTRNEEKIKQILLINLISNPDYSLSSIETRIAGIAARKECAKECKWFFDFDSPDADKLDEFIHDLIEYDDFNDFDITTYNTPYGYAVSVSHGFDTRKLMEKWGKDDIVSLKRDDLICVDWDRKA